MSAITRKRIVVLGAGFAGVALSQELARLLPREVDCEITLVDQNNFSLFTPMLTEVVGGDVDPEDIVSPVRRLSPRITFEQGRVDGIALNDGSEGSGGASRVTLTVGGGDPRVPVGQQTLDAEHLVIALGSVTNFHHIKGLREQSLTIKSVAEAAAIRNRALALLERADAEHDRARQQELLTFVVGGGGFSGVETVAALNDFVRGSAGNYPGIRPEDIRMFVVHPESRLLPEISESLAAYAKEKLEDRGVTVVLNTKITGASADSVDIEPEHAGNKSIRTNCLIWAGGVMPSPIVGVLDLKRGHHGGIVVDGTGAVPGRAGLWALGDCAEMPEPGSQKTYAPTAQNATREGAQVARNIVATMHGEMAQPFVYRPIGELAIVGKRSGVASLYGVHLSGLIAWIMWRAIYLAKMPRTSQRVRVGINWLLDLIFGREIAEISWARPDGTTAPQ